MKVQYRQNPSDTFKAVIGGTFAVLNAYIKKKEKAQVNDLMTQLIQKQ